MADTLYDRIYDKKKLTADEVKKLVDIFGYRCREKTKDELRRSLRAVPMAKPYGIYSRIILSPRVDYLHGQSYDDEIRAVRKCLIGQ